MKYFGKMKIFYFCPKFSLNFKFQHAMDFKQPPELMLHTTRFSLKSIPIVGTNRGLKWPSVY